MMPKLIEQKRSPKSTTSVASPHFYFSAHHNRKILAVFFPLLTAVLLSLFTEPPMADAVPLLQQAFTYLPYFQPLHQHHIHLRKVAASSGTRLFLKKLSI
jgi:hypothetical protein